MNIETLLDRFKKMLLMEEEARDRYEYYVSRIDDGSIKKQLLHIRDDEVRHVGIVKEMIKYLSMVKNKEGDLI